MGKKDVISKEILKNIARDKIDYTYDIIDLKYYTKKESTVQVALNLGTININDQEVARFIQNKNIDEMKELFLNFLKNQITTHQKSDSLDNRLKNLKVINPEKSRRVREALDSLNKKLEPLKNIDIELEKDRYIKEKFSL